MSVFVHMSELPVEAREGHRLPIDGVTGSCKLFYVVAGN